MYFTLLFEKFEGPTEIYELCFHPAVVWMKNGEVLCQPHKGPHLLDGDFRYLLDYASINRMVKHVPAHVPPTVLKPRKIGIVVHDSGHGDEDDLDLLFKEVKSEGFVPKLLELY